MSIWLCNKYTKIFKFFAYHFLIKNWENQQLTQKIFVKTLIYSWLTFETFRNVLYK